jgi:hypothetical protein
VDRGVVLYLAGERQVSVQQRIRAWAVRNGKELAELPVPVLDQPLNLLRFDEPDLEGLADAIKYVCATFKVQLRAIVADTLHSLTPGSKEDAHSFGLVLYNIRKLRDRAQQDAALIYCHHTGKEEDRGPRDSNSLTAGMSLSMAITVRQQKYRLVEVDKNSDLPDRPHIEPFTIENVTVGKDDDGQTIRYGCHIAVPLSEVPTLSADEAKARAAIMASEGKSIRSVAAELGHPKSAVEGWLRAAKPRLGT